jgi:hypothetical protein
MATTTVSTAESYTYSTGVQVALTVAAGTVEFAVTQVGGTGFLAQVQVAMCMIALAILAAEDKTVPNYHARIRYSRLILGNQGSLFSNIAYAIASDGVTGLVPSISSSQQLVTRGQDIFDELSANAMVG